MAFLACFTYYEIAKEIKQKDIRKERKKVKYQEIYEMNANKEEETRGKYR
jgi:hypothetical protein